jgi:hypothetical protein
MVPVPIDVEKILAESVKSWKYAVDSAESFVNGYKDKEHGFSSADLFIALDHANEVISNASAGSLYYVLMETTGLSDKYKGDFTHLWARAKEVKFDAMNEINEIMEKPAEKKPAKK